MFSNEYDIETLVVSIDKEINEILKANLYEVGLDEEDISLLRAKKNQLREALNSCGIGDRYSKLYVKNIIGDIIDGKVLKNANEYNKVIPFNNSNKLSAREKFDILLYTYAKDFKTAALEKIIEDIRIISGDNIMSGGNICSNDVDMLYSQKGIVLRDADKREIIIQRIYATYRGLGIIDEIRDMQIDGVSGGVSGKSGDFKNTWIFYKGMTIHLSFLDYETQEELERICMNIYRYGNPGQLSKSKGYIVNEMKDNSRVVVVRPPFSESFAFFVRKFDTIECKDISELLTDKGKELAIKIIKWIIKGCQVTAVTGAQGVGKTTLLMSLIEFILPSYTLRIQEMAFELHLREIYPDRNILTFRETDEISGQTGLDIQKKTDGSVNILGEVASIEVASYLIQMSQTGSLFTIFTHHAKTTGSLIKYMRNSLLSSGLFRDESIATEQVTDAIRFDIHMEKDIYGHRYIERITEIVRTDDKGGYCLNDIIVYEEGEYKQMGQISETVKNDIIKRLTKEDKEEFLNE